MTLRRCASVAVLTFTLAGCQAVPSPILINAVPVYATIADAQAVSAGQFGAVPMSISIESDLEVLAASCSSNAAQVRLRSGKVGWIPINSLPPALRDCQRNPSQDTAQKLF